MSMICKLGNIKELSNEILNRLYLLIFRAFEELEIEPSWHDDAELDYQVNELYNEFKSLSYYEQKLVFPRVVEYLANPNISQHAQSMNELEKLTKQKESRIYQLAENVENTAKLKGLTEKHSIFGLIFLFQNAFKEMKNKWHSYVQDLHMYTACPTVEHKIKQ